MHGGPTSSAWSALSVNRAFFTSRGIAVVDVNYRGSDGYGRAYRDALNGGWGVVDVDDSTAAARFLAGRGDVDESRMAIMGGSAGGFSTLACLAFRPEVFAAGISLFGIADLELIHEDTHKFESGYEEGLVAPWDDRAVWRERSPIHSLDRIRAPLLLLQGLDDRVVPPSQLDVMEAAFRARGLPYVALRFEGEGHGFRRAETRRAQFRSTDRLPRPRVRLHPRRRHRAARRAGPCLTRHPPEVQLANVTDLARDVLGDGLLGLYLGGLRRARDALRPDSDLDILAVARAADDARPACCALTVGLLRVVRARRSVGLARSLEVAAVVAAGRAPVAVPAADGPRVRRLVAARA